jgi:hypothetical protein
MKGPQLTYFLLILTWIIVIISYIICIEASHKQYETKIDSLELLIIIKRQ